MDDPCNITIAFLLGLPTTIKRDVLSFVLIYGFDYFSSDYDFDAALDRHMNHENVSTRGVFGATLRAIAVTDFVLARSIPSLKEAEWRFPLMRQHVQDNDRMTAMLDTAEAGREIRLRHAEQAQNRWQSLRAGPLSHQSLMDFEGKCLSQRPS